ncbi:MAG: hypothetical protein JWM80_2554 [Cyanobacteria bacterium RYN_339]|nr:hypothetical protein [Cyanobacteria bacterium RYN_339]
MQTPYPETLERVAAWRADPEVEAIVWIGSRSRGLAGDDADDDLEVYLAPAAFALVDPLDSFVMEPAPGSDPPRLIYDAQLTTLAQLQAKAASSSDPDHWTYERAQVLFDRTGVVTEAAKQAAVMAPAFRRARIQHGTLDALIAVNRIKKSQRRGNEASTRMLVARAVKALSRVVFALEGRWVPLDHWLEPELRTLGGEAPLLLEGLLGSCYQPLQEALERLTPRLADEGFPATDRARFGAELRHPARAAERAIHGLD